MLFEILPHNIEKHIQSIDFADIFEWDMKLDIAQGVHATNSLTDGLLTLIPLKLYQRHKCQNHINTVELLVDQQMTVKLMPTDGHSYYKGN